MKKVLWRDDFAGAGPNTPARPALYVSTLLFAVSAGFFAEMQSIARVATPIQDYSV
jgi:hypothetical protein